MPTTRTRKTTKPSPISRRDVGIRVAPAEFRTWQAYGALPTRKQALVRRFVRLLAEGHAGR